MSGIPRSFPSARGLAAGLLGAFLALMPARSHAEAAPIFLDGFFSDWTGPVDHVDPTGDGGTSGIDFTDVDLANDDSFLFVRFQIGVEVKLQETNPIELYLDTDMNAATGYAVNGIGAELVWQFGSRVGRFYRNNGTNVTIRQNDIVLRQLPSVTSPEFEIAISRNAMPDGSNLLFTGNSMSVVLRDVGTNGDMAPDNGTTLTYTFDSTHIPEPTPPDLARADAGDVRIVSWNSRDLDDFPSGAAAAADRVFSALDPDVISFQEMYNASATQTATELESWLPSGAGEAWYTAKQNDCIVGSRFPILSQWGLDANLAVLLDADAALGNDLLLVSAHLPCCTNDGGRQDEVDHIMSFFRDAMSAGGSVTVPEGTVFMVTGDLNLVGYAQQLVTLLTGDIVDNATYGPDFTPDWDGTDLGDVVSSQAERRFAYTWRSDTSYYAPGRLDFIIYSDSAAELASHFILYTPEMSPSQLSMYGMQADDVTTVSDHLPHVSDFHQAVPTGVGDDVATSGRLRIQGAPSTEPGTVRFTVTLAQPSRLQVQLFDVRGKLVTTLRSAAAGVLPRGVQAFLWDGHDRRGTNAPSGTYFVRATATPARGAEAQVATGKLVLLH